MSSEDNKAIVRRFIGALNQGDLTTAMDLLAPDYLDTDAPPGTPRGTEGWLQTHQIFFDAFPDLRLDIQDSIAEGDQVVTRWTATGAHTGTFPGLPTTGRQVSITGMSLGRIVNGRFVENLDIVDRLGMLQQLGAIPAPAESGM
jgi:steroid delta-isomerase-like uncharacterized protein